MKSGLITNRFLMIRKEKSMADYIDREKLLKSIPSVKNDKTISLFGAVADMICMVNAVPKEDVAPVVHGEWLCAETDDEQFFLCSVCNDKEYWESNYCPNCGAKMDVEQEE
nr:MAG TPA: PROTEIN/RNA Complex, archaeal, ribosomal, 50S, protein.0A [Caudoviricetes sp.]